MSHVTEAIREWAWNVGAYPDNIGRQWLLSDYDSWERNPHYTGPNQGHPEDPEDDGDEFMTVGLPTGANDPPYFSPIGGSVDDDIPF